MGSWWIISHAGCSGAMVTRIDDSRREGTGRARSIALLALLSSAGAVAAQQPAAADEELDQGRFEVWMGGQRIGTEVFAIRRVGSKIRAVGRLQLEPGVESVWPYEVRLQTNTRFEPEIYELQFMGGPVRNVVGRRTENGLLVHTATETGDRFKEFATAAGTVILETGSAHHFYILFRRLGADGAPTGRHAVPVLVPTANRAAQAGVVRAGPTKLNIGGRSYDVTRYDVSVGEVTHEVFIDSEGRVLKVAAPESGWQAIRAQGD